MADSLEAINKSLARDLSISSDDTKGDGETSTPLPGENSSDDKLPDEIPVPASDTPSPEGETVGSDQPTPDTTDPEVKIPVIVTDEVQDETKNKRRSL